MSNTYNIGDIFWFDLNGVGNVQNGWHPGIIVQNNTGNKYSPTMAVVPITSKTKTNLPTHVFIKHGGSCGLPKDSIAQCEGQQLVCKADQVGGYIGKADEKIMRKIAKGCLINTPYVAYLDDSDIDEIKNRAAI